LGQERTFSLTAQLHDPIKNISIESGGARLTLRLNVFGHEAIGQFDHSWRRTFRGLISRRVFTMRDSSKDAFGLQSRLLWRYFSDCPYCVPPVRRAAP